LSSAEPHSGERSGGNYAFGNFTLDVQHRVLRRAGEEVTLRRKSFEVLAYLVSHHGELVSKAALMDSVWQDTAVTDNSLAQCMVEIRRALDDDSQQLVRTVARRGYVFTAPMTMPVLELPRQGAVGPACLPVAALRVQVPAAKYRVLRGPGIVIMAAALTLVVIWLLSSRREPIVSRHELKWLAVLPFENLSGDRAQEQFSDGLTEAIIGNLARIRALKVISRKSTMRYKGTRKSMPQIAHELHVDAVISGTLQRCGGRVRVTAQLIDAATDVHLWTGEYDRDLTDVLTLESEVALAVAEQVGVQVSVEEQTRLASTRRVSPEAHEAYLLGRHHSSRNNEEGWNKAIEYFERAIRLAPDYARAYAGLSEAWLLRGLSRARTGFKEAESPARAAALKSIELDEQLAEGHIALSLIKQHYEWDWAGAGREIRRALELDPGSLDVHTSYGYFLMHLGRHDEAIREGEIAVQLDPASWASHSALGRFLYFARRYEEALLHQQRAVELEPRSVVANFRLADVYAQLGRFEEAIAAYEKNRDVEPKGGNFQAAIARLYALTGRKREAQQMIGGARASAYDVASAYAAFGDIDQAFRILEKAVCEHELLTPLKVWPPLDVLHSDPRWQGLLSRMNFLQETRLDGVIKFQTTR
jgi:TolB-like protein/DNA-binding winged helix-turn-helix (wHTH) protein/Flp pilus assembly protein TadD